MLSSAGRTLATSSRLTHAAAVSSGRRHASTIALKYSQALYNAALAKSPATLQKVHAELAGVQSNIKSTPALSSFIADPTLPLKDRLTGLDALFSTTGKKDAVSDITRNTFILLSENGRLGETPAVIEGFNELFATYKGELEVTVTSAAPLPKDVLSRLESALKSSQAGQKAKVLKISNKVRPFFSRLRLGSWRATFYLW